MHIEQERFLDFLGKPDTRFVIPVFQRVYSWNARQCEDLWDDIVAASDTSETHFMGMVLYVDEAETFNGVAQHNVIDGQQRLTTLSLLLCALARHLDETGSSVEGITAPDLFTRYLRSGEGAQASGKLTLSQSDRETLYALVGVNTMPEEPAGRLIDNLELFFAKMAEPNFDASKLWSGLEKLEIASVRLDYGDSPQLVFESLNSKGMALSTADRVRNYIVITDDANDHSEDALFEHSWLPFEATFEDRADDFDANAALNVWLANTYRNERIFDESEIYGLFKRSLRDTYKGEVSPLLEDAARYARELFDDDERRSEELADLQLWISGKPKGLISEYKMFGD